MTKIQARNYTKSEFNAEVSHWERKNGNKVYKYKGVWYYRQPDGSVSRRKI